MISKIMLTFTGSDSPIAPHILHDAPGEALLYLKHPQYLRRGYSVLRMQRDAPLWQWRPSAISNAESPCLNLFFERAGSKVSKVKIYEGDQVDHERSFERDAWDVLSDERPKAIMVEYYDHAKDGVIIAIGPSEVLERLGEFLCKTRLRGEVVGRREAGVA